MSNETCFFEFKRRGGYLYPNLGVTQSDIFLTDFDFVNHIEHKAEQIISFYGDKEHNGRFQSLCGKRRLNRVFDAMVLYYADRASPSTSLLVEDAAPCGHRTHSQRGRRRKVMARHGTSTTALGTRKRKRGRCGCGFIEPTDIQIGREVVGKVGNSKMVVLG